MPRRKSDTYENIANFLKSQNAPVGLPEMEILMVTTGWKDVVSRSTIYRLLSDKINAASYGIVELPQGSKKYTYSAKALMEFNQRGFELYGNMPTSVGNTEMMNNLKMATKDIDKILATTSRLDELEQTVVDKFKALRTAYASDGKLRSNLTTAENEGMDYKLLVQILANPEVPTIAKRIASLTYALYGSD